MRPGSPGLRDRLMARRELQQRLGYEFQDAALLDRALSHRSVGAGNNERLEFLGDSVLNFLVAEALYEQFPDAREGVLSRLRASLVKKETLAALARELELGSDLRLGSGERKSGGHRRDSILADAFEAVLGAVLLDGGIASSRAIIRTLFAGRLAAADSRLEKDAKTRLQEWLQARGHGLPAYRVLRAEGEDHDQEFIVECRVPALACCGEGRGSSRRGAEQVAAASVLGRLEADV